MIITPDDFKNEGEVDITANYHEKGKTGRVSIRKQGNNYELYVYWFLDKKETVLYSGTLKECIKISNATFGMNDKVEC